MSSGALDIADRPNPATGVHGSARTAGLVATVLGAGLLISSFTWAAWLRFPLEVPGRARFTAQITFADLADPQRRRSPQPALMSTYFSWLAWTLLAVAVLGVLLALGPLRSVLAVRIGALLTALCGLAITATVLRQWQITTRVHWRPFVHASSTGVWFAVAGFALICVAALVTLRSSDSAKPAVE